MVPAASCRACRWAAWAGRDMSRAPPPDAAFRVRAGGRVGATRYLTRQANAGCQRRVSDHHSCRARTHAKPLSSKSPIVATDCHTPEQCENRCRFVASHFVASKSVFWVELIEQTHLFLFSILVSKQNEY